MDKDNSTNAKIKDDLAKWCKVKGDSVTKTKNLFRKF